MNGPVDLLTVRNLKFREDGLLRGTVWIPAMEIRSVITVVHDPKLWPAFSLFGFGVGFTVSGVLLSFFWCFVAFVCLSAALWLGIRAKVTYQVKLKLDSGEEVSLISTESQDEALTVWSASEVLARVHIVSRLRADLSSIIDDSRSNRFG